MSAARAMRVETAHDGAGAALAPRDAVVLVTSRSTYTFLVEDPCECKGVLVGGQLPGGRRAVFGGVFDGPGTFRAATLRAGARAGFFVDGADASQFSRFITSRVLEIRVVREP